MEHDETPSARSRRPVPHAVLRWVAVAVCVGLAVRSAGLGRREVADALGLFAHLDPVLIAAVLGLQIGWAFTLSRVMRSAVLAVGGRLRGGQALRISMAGFTLSRVVPGGGAAGGLFAMRELTRLGQTPAVAVSAAVASWATSVTSLAVLILGGFVVVATLGQVPAVPVAPGITALAALAAAGGVVLGALHHDGWRRGLVALAARTLRRIPAGRDLGALERAFAAIGHSRGRGRDLRAGFGWATGAWLCDAAALWLVFAACGHRLSPAALLVGYGSANLLNSLPELTPGWLGVFEAALSATYIGLGVPPGVAVAAVLVYRLASFWLPVAAGIPPAVRSLGSARHSVTRVQAPRCPVEVTA